MKTDKKSESYKDTYYLTQSSTDLTQPTTTNEWLAENRTAIVEYNQFVEKNGVFSDGLRSF